MSAVGFMISVQPIYNVHSNKILNWCNNTKDSVLSGYILILNILVSVLLHSLAQL